MRMTGAAWRASAIRKREGDAEGGGSRGPVSDEDAETGWRGFLPGPFAPSLLLVGLAVRLHATDSLVAAAMPPAAARGGAMKRGGFPSQGRPPI